MRFGARREWILHLVALASAILFFLSLERLWPLAKIDLAIPPERLIEAARDALALEGIDVTTADTATGLVVDDSFLDYHERTFGRDESQRLIADGHPIYVYRVWFREYGDPDTTAVSFHPARGVIAWSRTLQDDAPGAHITAAEARVIAEAALQRWSPLEEDWEPAGSLERERIARRDHVFIFERWLSREPELRERVTVTVNGDRVLRFDREMVLPEEARRELRSRQASVVALQMVAFIIMAVAVVAAFVVFLRRLRVGAARLAPAAWLVAAVAAAFLIAQSMRRSELLLSWDPLWPRWIADLQSLGWMSAQGAWIMLVLFVVIAAGDSLDRESGAHRGESLLLLGRGRFGDDRVGLASLRGFSIGLICGAVLSAVTLLLEFSAGAWSAIQPRGFFFMALNSAAPTLATLLYFLMVSLVEELSYRYFAGSLLLNRTRLRWVAILVPAVLYGASHTGLPFIPPAEPFWGRALVFTAIGIVWGWAFLRYDALTVVLSHWAADLFIFNWPRLASGDPTLVIKSVLAIAVPLVPGVIWMAMRATRRFREA